MPLPITILRQYHQSELGSAGDVVRYVRVDFRVGTDGPFTVSILESNFSADNLNAKIREIAHQVEQLRTLNAAPPK